MSENVLQTAMDWTGRLMAVLRGEATKQQRADLLWLLDAVDRSEHEREANSVAGEGMKNLLAERSAKEQVERERNEALAALRPFAEAADLLLESRHGNDDWSLWTATYPGGSTSITAAHIREARNVVDHYGGR